jgi:Rad3-related DNA helicase
MLSPSSAHAVTTAADWGISTEDVLASFPEGFTPRPQQEFAIKEICRAFAAGARFVVLEAPTGTGKEFVAVSFARALRKVGGRTHILTIQKNLQDQYTNDFPPPEIESLKGRATYPCTHPRAEGANAANGVCKRKQKGILPECIVGAYDGHGTPRVHDAIELRLSAWNHLCPYWQQLQKCHDAPISLFNFSSFLYQARLGRFPKRELMVADEGHNIESQLMNFFTLELTERALSSIGVRIDRNIETKEELFDWLSENEVLERIKAQLEHNTSLKDDDREALEKLALKIESFLNYLERAEWVIETAKDKDRRGNPTKKIVARPLYVRAFAERLLFRHAERILVMSATILSVRVWAESLGIPKSDIVHVVVENAFPVKNRLIHCEYAGNMGRKYFHETKPRLVEKVAEILERHKGQRGIIHCHSFELARVILSEIPSKRFLFQEDFDDDKTTMLAEHARREDSVIVAPAMHEGVDLKDDLSRFQIIAKVPWPSLGDKLVSERARRDQFWYDWMTALKLVQSYGRSIRSAQDWATTYIVDSGFGFFLRQCRWLLPRWFREAIVVPKA